MVTALSAPRAVSGTGPQSKAQKTPWSEPKTIDAVGQMGEVGRMGAKVLETARGCQERGGGHKREGATLKITEEPKLAEPLGKGGG